MAVVVPVVAVFAAAAAAAGSSFVAVDDAGTIRANRARSNHSADAVAVDFPTFSDSY